MPHGPQQQVQRSPEQGNALQRGAARQAHIVRQERLRHPLFEVQGGVGLVVGVAQQQLGGEACALHKVFAPGGGAYGDEEELDASFAESRQHVATQLARQLPAEGSALRGSSE
jgi:hypothetical protein